MHGSLYLISKLVLSFPPCYLAGTEAKLSDKKKKKEQNMGTPKGE